MQSWKCSDWRVSWTASFSLGAPGGAVAEEEEEEEEAAVKPSSTFLMLNFFIIFFSPLSAFTDATDERAGSSELP